MRPIGCARKRCGPGAVSQVRYPNLSFSLSLNVVYASSRTRAIVFLFSFCGPKEASVAELLGGSSQQPRGPPISVVASTARPHRTVSSSFRSPTGKQAHVRVRPLPGPGHPPTTPKGKQQTVSSRQDAGEGGSPRATVLSAVALSRLRMRPSFMQRPGPRAFRQYLRTLAHPSLRLGDNLNRPPRCGRKSRAGKEVPIFGSGTQGRCGSGPSTHTQRPNPS